MNNKKKGNNIPKIKKGLASNFDFLGSWTGVNLLDKYEKPEQDVDDL